MPAMGSNQFRKSLKSPRGKIPQTYLEEKKRGKLCLGHVVVTFFGSIMRYLDLSSQATVT